MNFQLEPMQIRIPRLCPESNKTEMIDHPVMLPHETFHILSQFNEAFDSRVLAGSADHSTSLWRRRSGASWYHDHPARSMLAEGRVVAPLRLYGDDAEVGQIQQLW